MVLARIIETAVRWYEGYLWTLTFADKRVEKWPLMSSPKYTAYWIFAYLLMSWLGPKVMRPFPAVELRWLLVAYNAAMVVLNAYICIEVLITALSAGYSFQCEPVDYSNDPLAVRMAAVLWWFYVSKLCEFVDTLFFILRKKFNQLTFLHVYHHSTMFGFWWIGIKWVAGGSSFLGALLNSFVHVLMYAYYALAAAFPQRNFWWKRYLTVIQLAQFNFAIVQTIRGLYMDCPFPRWMGYTLIGYMISFIILFGNFWFHAYGKRVKKTVSSNMDFQDTSSKKTEAAHQSQIEEQPRNGFIYENGKAVMKNRKRMRVAEL